MSGVSAAPFKEANDPEDWRVARRRIASVETPWALCAMLISAAVAIFSLRLWEWRVGTPLDLDGDSPFVAMQLRDVYDHGWYWFNPDLGYPLGQNGSLFPELNVVHVAIVKMLGLVFADAYTPGVLYFVLGFPLAALTAYLLGRSQRIGRPAALVLGVLFSHAPGHQESFEHMWLAAYWTVPVALWIVLSIAAGRPLWARREGSVGVAAWLTPKFGLTLAALTIVGLSGVYYAAFTMLLLVVATLGRRIAGGRSRDWLPGIGITSFLAVVVLIPLLLARNATFGEVIVGSPPATRHFSESELYAGKLMDLLLPWPGHRIDGLALLNFAYNSGSRPTVEIAALGAVAATGVVALGVGVLRQLFSGVGLAGDPRRWAALAGASFGFYTVGGLGSMVAIFVTPVVRTWSRISIFIVLLGLLAVTYWLTHLQKVRGRVIAGSLCVMTLGVGVLDQTNPDRAPNYEAINARWASYTQYVDTLEDQTGPGCAVFQLPVVNFPESLGVGGMAGYDQLIPYLSSDRLRWSSGAMRGTAASAWQTAIDLGNPEQLVRQLAATGFCALEVNTEAFDSQNDPRRALEAELGAPVAQSADGVYVAYELRREDWHDGDGEEQLLKPVLVALDAYEFRRYEDGLRQWVAPSATLRLVNLQSSSVPLTISMSVRAEGAARRIRIVDEEGVELLRSDIATSAASSIEFEVAANPGVSRLRLTLSGEPVRLRDPRIWVSAEVTGLSVSSTRDVRVASYMEQVAIGVAVP